MRRYSNRPDLLEPIPEVLRRIEVDDMEDEPGGVELREGGSSRPGDRPSEADIQEIVAQFTAGVPKAQAGDAVRHEPEHAEAAAEEAEMS